MRYQRLLQNIRIALYSIVFILSGCIGSTTTVPTLIPTLPTSIPPTLTPTIPSAPKTGIWIGSVTFGGTAFFQITQDNKIRNFSIEIPLGVDLCTVTPNDEIVVEPDGSFIIGNIDAEGRLETNSIKGNFDTPTSMTGAYSSSWFCGGTASGSSEEGTWSAIWQE